MNSINKETFVRSMDTIRAYNRASYYNSEKLRALGFRIEDDDLIGWFMDQIVKIFENAFNDNSHSGTKEEPHGRDSIISMWAFSLDSSDDHFKNSGEVYDHLIKNNGSS